MARWFIAASLFSVLVAVAIAFVAIKPLLERQPTVVTLPSSSAGRTDTAGESGAAPEVPPLVTPQPRQLDEKGAVLPWGSSTLDRLVTLELKPFDRSRMMAALFEISRNDAPTQTSRSSEFSLRLENLDPGRYRWSARVELRDGGVSSEIIPLRGDIAAADFIVLPPPPAIRRLSQVDLDGKPLGADRRVESAVRLAVELFDEFPAGVLQFEVSPLGAPGDPQLIEAKPSGKGAEVRFSGADGRYRWRARLVPPSRQPEPWRDAAIGPGLDFILFSKPAEKPPEASKPQTPPRDSRSPPPSQQAANTRPSGATTATNTGSGGLGQGSRAPRPSEQVEQSSFWQVAFMRLLMGLGVIAVALGALVLALRGLRRLLARS